MAWAQVGTPEARMCMFVHTRLADGLRQLMNDIRLGTHRGAGQ